MYPDFVGSLGFSQHTLEMIVFFGIIIFVLGAIIVLYWKHIVVGIVALSCLVVMANHKSTVKQPVVEPVIEKKEEIINHVKPIDTPTPTQNVVVPEVKPIQAETPTPVAPATVTPKVEESKDVRKEFMDKCINLADYTRTQCDELWDDRVQEEREMLLDTKHKGKKHGSYRKV